MVCACGIILAQIAERDGQWFLVVARSTGERGLTIRVTVSRLPEVW